MGTGGKQRKKRNEEYLKNVDATMAWAGDSLVVREGKSGKATEANTTRE